jgi:hypothetical protein
MRAIASNILDFPDPFGPTRIVIGFISSDTDFPIALKFSRDIFEINYKYGLLFGINDYCVSVIKPIRFILIQIIREIQGHFSLSKTRNQSLNGKTIRMKIMQEEGQSRL